VHRQRRPSEARARITARADADVPRSAPHTPATVKAPTIAPIGDAILSVRAARAAPGSPGGLMRDRAAPLRRMPTAAQAEHTRVALGSVATVAAAEASASRAEGPGEEVVGPPAEAAIVSRPEKTYIMAAARVRTPGVTVGGRPENTNNSIVLSTETPNFLTPRPFNKRRF